MTTILRPSRSLLVLLAALAGASDARAKNYRISVSAGGVPREQSVVGFELPEEGGHWRLRDEAGRDVPLQVRGREAAFILPRLEAGGTGTFRLEPGRAAGATGTGVRLERSGGKIVAHHEGRTLLAFQEEKSTPPRPDLPDYYSRGGYLHPVFSPSGTLVTDDYPPDHFHHHGIWFAWVKTEYEGRHPDFWNVQDGLGRLDFKGVEGLWSGPVFAGIQARFQSVDIKAPMPKAVVDDKWEVRIYAVGGGPRPYHMFELISSQQIIGLTPLKLPTYRYGGVGIRGHAQWIGTGDKTRFLTSTGERDRLKAHESRAVWCHMGGLVDGRFTGIATLAHPENFRSPEPMRVNPKIPFLNFAPSQAGDWEMVPGRTYVWRYRFIVQDGAPDQAWLESRWQDYAQPVKVTVQEVPS